MNEFWQTLLDIFLDSLFDSLKVLGFTFVVYVLLSFFEVKIVNLFEKHKKLSPIIGSVSGLIPQCGVSVVASDLYIKDHITMGTLVAVFFACSDEGLPLLIGAFNKMSLYAIPLLIIKMIGGFTLGYLVDLIFKRHIKDDYSDVDEGHIGCCHHDIDDEENEPPVHRHLIHPLLHSLKIFAYILVVNIVLGLLIEFVMGGEEGLSQFLEKSKWLSPLYSVLIGLIPNCASSVVLVELFLDQALPFGSMLAGLCVNAGLGLMFLIKSKEKIKDTLIILGILVVSSLIVGYLTIAVTTIII